MKNGLEGSLKLFKPGFQESIFIMCIPFFSFVTA